MFCRGGGDRTTTKRCCKLTYDCIHQNKVNTSFSSKLMISQAYILAFTFSGGIRFSKKYIGLEPLPDRSKIVAYISCNNCGKQTELAAGVTYTCANCSKDNCLSTPRYTNISFANTCSSYDPFPF